MGDNFMKKIKSLIVSLTVFSLCFTSLVNVNAMSVDSLDNQIININGENYKIFIDSDSNQRSVSVIDENGENTKAVFDTKTNKLTVNGIEIKSDIEENSINSVAYRAVANKVLKRNTYTIPGYLTSTATVLVAGLAAISNFPFAAAVISAIVSGNLWDKELKIIITEYRSGSKYTSGSHKGRYKYWTNVVVKCGKSTVLNQNHSVYFSK